jgi:hypothetical protein|tara:strand:+ start:715 stop:1410 length:696 start_codon:yes stop_codon:yes gene_type:complete
LPDSHPYSAPQFKSPSFWHKYQFWLFLIAGAIIRQIPIVSIPFNWLETYFHEISHGLAAIATGGTIIKLQLFANGSGLCTTQGGSAFFISFFGYAGAILWGGLIYSLAGHHQRLAQFFSGFVIFLLSASILLWARDILTIIILAALLTMFIMTIKLKKLKMLQKFVQLLGIIVLLNSMFSPLYLLDGRSLGDGATLSASTAIPEILWVTIWLLLALTMVFLLSRLKATAYR